MKRLSAITLAAALLAAGLPCLAAPSTVTVKLPYMLTMNPAKDRAQVQDAINKITKPKLGIEVSLVCIEFGNWNTQINLMLTDGSIDLFNSCFTSPLSVLANNGQIAEIDGLLKANGQGILKALGGYIDCAKVDGHYYGAPKMSAFGIRDIYLMNKAVCKELGIDPSKVKNLDDLTAVLAKVKKAHPEKCMIPTGKGGSYLNPMDVDTLGSSSLALGVLLGGGKELKVVNYYETAEFKKMIGYARKWKSMGFFLADPLSAQDASNTFLKTGEAFGAFNMSHEAAAGARIMTNSCGVELLACNVDEAVATTDSVTGMTWCVSATSRNKAAAVKLLNELYTNADLANLVCSGIEGVHYVVGKGGAIDYAPGLNAFTTGWPSGMGTFWPNVTITKPWAPEPADAYADWLAANKTCRKSAALGFTFDASEVGDEIAACTNVVNQYYNPLMLGFDEDGSLLAKFQGALKKAGIDAIVAEKQKQLDAWAKARK